MRDWVLSSLSVLALAAVPLASAQNGAFHLPKAVKAGDSFSIPTSGNGKAVFYLVGPGGVLRRDVHLGEAISIASEDLQNAGHYLAIVSGDSASEVQTLEVTASQPVALGFLAKPSRLPVNLHNGISGVVYVFDAYHNLVVDPAQVSFQLTGASGVNETRIVATRNGVAWTKLDSASKQGLVQFVATVADVTGRRVVQQVPGDPCNLRMNVRQDGQKLIAETEPVRDCGGNPVSDGTIVTFTETYNGDEATVDVPLKRDIARTELPVHDGATITVAAGVVLGNEIHWK